MSIIRISNNHRLELVNGAAYGLIAGGAATFIAEEYKWYLGNNPTSYLAMLISRGVEMWRIVSIFAIRGAITYAAINHAAEVPYISHNNGLRLNASEVVDNAAVLAMTNRGRLVVGEWLANGVAPAADQPLNVDQIPLVYRTQLTSAEMQQWGAACAQMAYTILANNGYGLITAGHHFRGQAANAATNTLKMYNLDKLATTMGLVLKEVVSFLFHDTLHPISYEHVAQLANALPAAFSAKIAATVTKRLPAFPGGTTHIQRAITVRRMLSGYARLGEIIQGIQGTPADLGLNTLEAEILGNPLDFNAQFRPAIAPHNLQRVGRIVPYCVALFGMYDAAFPPKRGEDGNGPTRGEGMRKVIDENRATHQTAMEIAGRVIATTLAPDTGVFIAQVTAYTVMAVLPVVPPVVVIPPNPQAPPNNPNIPPPPQQPPVV